MQNRNRAVLLAWPGVSGALCHRRATGRSREGSRARPVGRFLQLEGEFLAREELLRGAPEGEPGPPLGAQRSVRVQMGFRKGVES